MLFKILLPFGLILIYVSLPLFVLSWILHIKKEYKKKQYLSAFLWIVFGILLILWELRRFL